MGVAMVGTVGTGVGMVCGMVWGMVWGMMETGTCTGDCAAGTVPIPPTCAYRRDAPSGFTTPVSAFVS